MKVGDKHLRLVFTSYSIPQIITYFAESECESYRSWMAQSESRLNKRSVYPHRTSTFRCRVINSLIIRYKTDVRTIVEPLRKTAILLF